ncbi:head GIN domain-containing protein [Henriciella sp.]|uniref:head GIN domain-containing protein n=1 Tax=Henriciella sp. TaxID=1968823 RepID=UPI0026147EDD|nr:head GIN domain-containing protein [Henriciella sp.]
MSRLAIIALATTATAALPALAETKTYNVQDFDGLEVSAGIKAIYETGTATSVEVENRDGDFSDIIVEVDDGDLILKRPRKMGWGNRTPYTVTIGVQSLEDVKASSGSSVKGNGLAGDDASIDVSSGAHVAITNIAAGEIEIETSSGSSVEASGTCNELEADASSGSEIRAEKLQCASVTADVSSGASIRAYATDSVNGDASSGGSIRVAGGAKNVTKDQSSGGSVSVK